MFAFTLYAGDVADRKVPTPKAVAVLERALELGVNLLDTAPSYEDGLSETIVGHVVRARSSRSVIPTPRALRPALVRLQLAQPCSCCTSRERFPA